MVYVKFIHKNQIIYNIMIHTLFWINLQIFDLVKITQYITVRPMLSDMASVPNTCTQSRILKVIVGGLYGTVSRTLSDI